jgi:sugar phosphate isomerase/epimerase
LAARSHAAISATGRLTVRPHSVVHQVAYDERRDRATGVRVIDAQTRGDLEFTARAIFLCSSALEATRILLNSRTPRFPTGLANSSGELGRNPMDHTMGGGASGTIPGREDREILSSERTIGRRAFVATAAGAVAAVARGVSGVGSAHGSPLTPHGRPRALDRAGIQLYSVRHAMQQDFEGTLRRVAEVGYEEVEFAGYFGRTPEQVRAILADAGLDAPASHVPFERVADGWDGMLDVAQAIGHGYVVVAWVAPQARQTLEDWRRIAGQFNQAGARARERGLRFAYHNHDFELAPTGGRLPLDLLLEETDPEAVEFEMDLYWTVKAGGDPLAYFARHPGRFPLVHVKDSAGPPQHRMVNPGEGVIDFRAIAARSAQAGIRHWFAEHDEPADPWGFARAAHAYLKGLRA